MWKASKWALLETDVRSAVFRSIIDIGVPILPTSIRSGIEISYRRWCLMHEMFPLDSPFAELHCSCYNFASFHSRRHWEKTLCEEKAPVAYKIRFTKCFYYRMRTSHSLLETGKTFLLRAKTSFGCLIDVSVHGQQTQLRHWSIDFTRCRS